MKSTLTSKGQITLPKALRDALHLSTGDKVGFTLGENNEVRLIPKHVSIQKLKGMLPRPEKIISLRFMDDAIESESTGA